MLIYAVGDVSPNRVTEWGEPADSAFEEVVDKLKKADVLLCQLARTLSTKGSMQYRAGPTTWYGRTHPDNVKILVHGGFNLIALANNHCFDYGPDALLETIDVLRANGMAVIGAGKNLQESRKPAIFAKNGNKAAFLNYNSVLPEEYEARENKAGCAPIHVDTYYKSQEFQPGTPPTIITIPHENDVRAMEEDIRQAKALADVVVVVMHWGIHIIPGMLADYEFTVGHRAIDAGADLILGAHAHTVKGIEVYKGKVIFHSVGDFAQESPNTAFRPPDAFKRSQRPHYGLTSRGEGNRGPKPNKANYSIMVSCLVQEGKIASVSFIPASCDSAKRGGPRLLTSRDPQFEEVVEFTAKWSSELGTKLEVKGDEVLVLT
jgi:poly-gamma-glutamate synthesis protein (capsule biosynthesis protein)